jgi:hypothetical protein
MYVTAVRLRLAVASHREGEVRSSRTAETGISSARIMAESHRTSDGRSSFTTSFVRPT